MTASAPSGSGAALAWADETLIGGSVAEGRARSAQATVRPNTTGHRDHR